MKREYNAPEIDIEVFNMPSSVFTTSDGGIEEGDNEGVF